MAPEPTPTSTLPLTAPQYPVYPLDFGSLRSLVEYRFTILDAYVDTGGTVIFVTAQQPIKEKFQELLHDLSNHNLIAKIRKVSDKLVIQIVPKPKLGRPRRAINLILLLATIGTVAYASYALTYDVDPQLKAILFSNSNLTSQVFALALSILGIVVLHETGHVLAVRRHRMDATMPYFIPAPPPFPFGTFGAVISLRGPPANRDQLFDLGFSGPLAGFLATLGVGFFLLLTAPIITTQQANALVAAKLLSPAAWPNIPLLLELLERANLRAVPPDHVMVLANTFFAVQVGCLITFLNILPVWQLDGGHISRATFGDQGHRLMALVGFGVLFLAGYWGFALLLLVFMFASRRPLQGLEPLDDISPLSNSRKALFALALVMLLLTFVIF